MLSKHHNQNYLKLSCPKLYPNFNQMPTLNNKKQKKHQILTELRIWGTTVICQMNQEGRDGTWIVVCNLSQRPQSVLQGGKVRETMRKIEVKTKAVRSHWRMWDVGIAHHLGNQLLLYRLYLYIYIYAWGPRFPQSRLVLNDSFVQNYCFAIAKWLFCTFFLFSLYCQFRGPKFLGPRTLHVMKCYTHYISFLRFLFFHTK